MKIFLTLGRGHSHRRNHPMGPVGRVPPTFEQVGTAVGRVPPNFLTYWDGPLQILKIVRQTRAQNALHLVSSAQNCVGFWGSAPDPDGGTYVRRFPYRL